MHRWLCAAAIAGLVFSPSCARPSVVHLVPIDAAPGFVDTLAGYYRENLGLDVQILEDMETDSRVFDRSRGQVVAEDLLALMRDRHSGRTQAGPVIGITAGDMYIRGHPSWQFAFSWRDRPYAVVSYARMDPRRLGEMAGRERLFRRLRKMTTRNIGVLAYGIAMNPDETSLMYQHILGVDDLDRIDEDLVRAGFPVVSTGGS
jgi:predicted Zn-dependent protease